MYVQHGERAHLGQLRCHLRIEQLKDSQADYSLPVLLDSTATVPCRLAKAVVNRLGKRWPKAEALANGQGSLYILIAFVPP